MILFIGDRPSKRTDPNVPFKGAACEKRLMEWVKIVAGDEEYAIYNRLQINWNNFSHSFCKIVALGNNASYTLTRHGVEHFKLPHPSGRNRQINHQALINGKLAECKEYLQIRALNRAVNL